MVVTTTPIWCPPTPPSPQPAPPWPRFDAPCVPITADVTTTKLDERRKVQILKYRGQASGRRSTNVYANTTKVGRYLKAVRGQLLPSQSFAHQTQTTTNPNVRGLPVKPGNLGALQYTSNVDGSIDPSACIAPPYPYYYSDVPGPLGPQDTL